MICINYLRTYASNGIKAGGNKGEFNVHINAALTNILEAQQEICPNEVLC